MGELPLHNLHKGGSSIDANYLQELINIYDGAVQLVSGINELESTMDKNKTRGTSGNEYQQARS